MAKLNREKLVKGLKSSAEWIADFGKSWIDALENGVDLTLSDDELVILNDRFGKVLKLFGVTEG